MLDIVVELKVSGIFRSLGGELPQRKRLYRPLVAQAVSSRLIWPDDIGRYFRFPVVKGFKGSEFSS